MNDQRSTGDSQGSQGNSPTGPLWHESQTPPFGTTSTPYPPHAGGGGFPDPAFQNPPEGAAQGAPAVPSSAPPTGKRRSARTPLLISGIAALLLVGGGAGAYLLNPSAAPTSTANPAASAQQRFPVGQAPVQQANASAPDWVVTAAAVAPSVVSITVTAGQSGGQGSGVIFDAQGHIVTNYHVVAAGVSGGRGSSSPTILVTLNDKRAYEATIVGTDPATDLAVLQLKDGPGDLAPIALGDDTTLKVGTPVMAVGNPLGLAGTVTTGIVSALNRPVTTRQAGDSGFGGSGEIVVTNAIQTSAAINPGNSGGALVNASGQLVGINSSIAQTSQDGGNIGIGFAIPVNEVRSVADQILRNGSVKHPYLGVTGKGDFVRDGGAQRAAAVIQDVTPRSPAAKAGLRPGDAVVAVDDEPVDSWESLVAQVRERDVASTITLTIVRDGQRSDVKATLAERPTGQE